MTLVPGCWRSCFFFSGGESVGEADGDGDLVRLEDKVRCTGEGSAGFFAITSTGELVLCCSTTASAPRQSRQSAIPCLLTSLKSSADRHACIDAHARMYATFFGKAAGLHLQHCLPLDARCNAANRTPENSLCRGICQDRGARRLKQSW